MARRGADKRILARHAQGEGDGVAVAPAEEFGGGEDRLFRFRVLRHEALGFLHPGLAGELGQRGARFEQDQVVAHLLERDFADVLQGQADFLPGAYCETFRVVGHLVIAGDLEFYRCLCGGDGCGDQGGEKRNDGFSHGLGGSLRTNAGDAIF